jgi:predicted PurR-regulated permease PerM
MYFGFSLFGITGLILAPLAVTVLLGVVREKQGISLENAK